MEDSHVLLFYQHHKRCFIACWHVFALFSSGIWLASPGEPSPSPLWRCDIPSRGHKMVKVQLNDTVNPPWVWCDIRGLLDQTKTNQWSLMKRELCFHQTLLDNETSSSLTKVMFDNKVNSKLSDGLSCLSPNITFKINALFFIIWNNNEWIKC